MFETSAMWRFEHAAMNTQFEIRCTHPDEHYARQAARAAFDAVDRLELQLSRFVENSDISRINHLSPGDATIVGYETMQCLQLASVIYTETGGAFDVSLGTGFDRLTLVPGEYVVRATAPSEALDGAGGGEFAPGTGDASISGEGAGGGEGAGCGESVARVREPSISGDGAGAEGMVDGERGVRATVQATTRDSGRSVRMPADEFVLRPAATGGVRLDLGAIGKGYAVDRMADVLEDWDICGALIHAGGSSVLALDPPGGACDWPLTLSIPGESGEVFARICARQRALGASGIQKGNHIVDPRSRAPVRARRAAWVSAPRRTLSDIGRRAGVERSATAVADALSTACMILPREAIASYCRRHPGLDVWILGDAVEHFPERDAPGSP